MPLVPTVLRGNAVFDAPRRLGAAARPIGGGRGASGAAFPRGSVGTSRDGSSGKSKIERGTLTAWVPLSILASRSFPRSSVGMPSPTLRVVSGSRPG